MRFIVVRGWSEARPCDDAVKGTYLRRDVRTTHCPTEIPCFMGKPEAAKEYWYGKGQNHRVEDVGHGKLQSVRDVPEEGWFIELATMEELVGLCLKYCPSAIGKSDSIEGEPLLRLDVEVE